MNEFTPPKPTGYNREAIFDQAGHEKAYGPAGQLRESKDIGIVRTAKGIFLRLRGSRNSPAATRKGPYQIDSVQDDYLTCYAYNNTTQARTGTTPVYIAKEDKHQTDLASETIFGVVHNYTYTPGTAPPGGLAATDVNNKFRTDSVTGEFQLITPPWLCGDTGDIIYADVTPGLGIDGTDGSAITLLIAGRSCQWAEVDQ